MFFRRQVLTFWVLGRVLQGATIQQWTNELNQWGRESYEQWCRDPMWNKDRTDRGGRALMGYFYRVAMHGTASPQGRLGTFLYGTRSFQQLIQF